MVDSLQSSIGNRFQTVMWTVKLGFLCIGIVSTVLILKLAVPYSVNAILSTIPRLWISFRSWLAPPYLYIVVNFIIVIIAASSSFQQKHWGKNNEESSVIQAENENQNKKRSDFSSDSSTSTEIWSDMEEIPLESVDKGLISVEKSPETCSDDVSCLTDFNEKATPDLSVSSRFAARKSLGTGIDKSVAPAAKPIGVVKRKKQNDTLDGTWKMITEGKGKPLTRHLKKSETWDVPPSVIDPDSEMDSSSPAVTNRRELRKLETFNDAASSLASSSSRGGRLNREKSLSQDELNRRVEAFIKKFNDEIRLQRQESYKRYVEMVNRGVY